MHQMRCFGTTCESAREKDKLSLRSIVIVELLRELDRCAEMFRALPVDFHALRTCRCLRCYTTSLLRNQHKLIGSALSAAGE